MTRSLLATAVAFLLLAPLAAEAQPAGKVPRLGILWPTSPPAARVEEFKQGLRELGYVEGQNVMLEYRYADGRLDRLPELAAQLVQLRVDVIVALSTLVARPAQKATSTIPIVAVSGDPVGTGLAKGLSRPGGNVTGLTFFSPELAGKRMELVAEMVPDIARVAVLWNPDGPAKVAEFRATEDAARTLKLGVQSLEVRAPQPDFEGAFARARAGGAQALLTLGNPLTLSHHTRIAELALRARLPSIYDARQFVEAGGLVSYGPSFSDVYRRAALYVDKILKGAKPADLPIEQPTKFELMINLKTARALGLMIPPSLLLRANNVIE
jgi:putative ABC transport system substrate-binding protein